MAVNVTLVPEQMVVNVAAILTDGITVDVTVIAIALDVAVGVVTQVSEVVNTTVITSPLTNVVLWNVAMFVPALTPFTFH